MVLVPATIDGLPVTSIGPYAFWRSLVTSVSIPEGVTTIGSAPFYASTNLTNVTVPGSLTDLGSYAFALCSSLTTVIIPDSVTNIAQYAFGECPKLANVTQTWSLLTLSLWPTKL